MSTTPAAREPAAPSPYAPPAPAVPSPAAEPPDFADRVARLERSAKRSGKDAWDVVQIIGSALIPVAIAAGGWFYSEASSRAEIESASRQHDRDVEIAVAESRVRQAGLLKDFLDALTGPDPAKRRVAIQAVLLALPQDGPKLVRELTRSTDDPALAQYATSTLATRRDALIQQLFAATAEERIAASQALVEGWRDVPALLDRLLPYARANAGNANGIFNTLGVLTQMTPAALAQRRPQVEAALDEALAAPGAGPRIRALVAQVRARLR
jgi:hypothetical protein